MLFPNLSINTFGKKLHKICSEINKFQTCYFFCLFPLKDFNFKEQQIQTICKK
jgi:hypothetical protein